MGQSSAITKHTVALNATTLLVDQQLGMVPVAIYAAAWVSASCTFGLAIPDVSGTPVYKVSDDAAVTLVDDKWSTIPEVLGRKLACGPWQITLLAAESGGPFPCWIAWAPLGGE